MHAVAQTTRSTPSKCSGSNVFGWVMSAAQSSSRDPGAAPSRQSEAANLLRLHFFFFFSSPGRPAPWPARQRTVAEGLLLRLEPATKRARAGVALLVPVANRCPLPKASTVVILPPSLSLSLACARCAVRPPIIGVQLIVNDCQPEASHGPTRQRSERLILDKIRSIDREKCNHHKKMITTIRAQS